MKLENLVRRTLLASALIGVVAGLAACTSPLTRRDEAASRQRAERLQALGFSPSDEGYVLNLDSNILFDTGSSDIRESALPRVRTLATQLLQIDIRQVRMLGHTDNIGSYEFNLQLSSARAQAVANAFIALGFARSDVQSIGLGFSRPAASNDTAEGRQKNRRVAIVVAF